LQANLVISASGENFDLLKGLGEDVRFIFLTSKVSVKDGDHDGFGVLVQKSEHEKCERCWHYAEDVGVDKEHENICLRCVASLAGKDEPRKYA
ncbi:MAG: zinc finger domain-containing protein, partial [Burkholderiales bacterium]